MIGSKSGSLTAATLTPKRLRLCELGLVELVILLQGLQEFFQIKFEEIRRVSFQSSPELRSFRSRLFLATVFLRPPDALNLLRLFAIIIHDSASLTCEQLQLFVLWERTGIWWPNLGQGVTGRSLGLTTSPSAT